MKAKPIVKYRQSTVKMCGEVHKLRYKLTLLATIKGPEAKAIAESQDKGECLYWSYDDSKGQCKLEIYEEQMITPLDQEIIAEEPNP